jgi:hypothetical protein
MNIKNFDDVITALKKDVIGRPKSGGKNKKKFVVWEVNGLELEPLEPFIPAKSIAESSNEV